MKERVEYVDVAKGILILMLLCNHFLWVGSGMNGIKVWSCQLLQVCDSMYHPFFMACFFCVTGMCSSFKGSSVNFVTKCFKQNILPCIVLGTLYFVVTLGIFYLKNEHLQQSIPLYFWKCVSQYWFLKALFMARLILYFSMKCTKRFLPFVCIAVYVAGCVLNISQIVPNISALFQAMILYPFLYMGYLLKSHQDLLGSKMLCLLPYPCMLVLAYTLDYNVPGVTSCIPISAVDVLPHLVIVPFGILFLLCISRQISRCSVLEVCGKNSLYIYCLHTIIYFNAIELFAQCCSVNNVTVAACFLLVVLLTLTSCICVGRIFSFPYLRAVIGKF